jgi:hypothetical protein
VDEVFEIFWDGDETRGGLAGIVAFAELRESEHFIWAVDAASLYDRGDGCLEPRVDLEWAGSSLGVALEASARWGEACFSKMVT